jgi:hypothetical protein
MKWITAQQLNDWSDSPIARVEFPALVANLIRASVPDISALRFPNGATGDMRGWDGHVVCDATAGRVATGDSYWELKTGKTAYAEGLKEFEARSGAMSAEDRAQATYNFVTSRTWNSDKKRPEDWVNECAGKGFGWNDIRCLDAIAVEDWLEQSPAVAAKFARFTLKTMPAAGARSSEEFWEDFRHSFDPALVEDVLLADRGDRAKGLLQALQAGTGITQFVSDSPDEAIAFGVAAIRRAPIEIREWLEAHTIVVDNLEASRDLLNIGKGLIFFLRGREPAVSAGAFSSRGATLVPLGRQQLGGATPYLERPTPNGLAEALQKMDFKPPLEHQAAVNLARDCGRSIVALQRLKPSGHAEPPKWVADAPMLLPALLAGAWDNANGKDKAILAKLADAADYYNYERKLRPFTVADDPPLDLAGTIWAVRAPRDAFLRVGPHIGPEVLATLRAVLAEVFGDAPLPPDPKAVIRLDRQSDGYSDWLRDGLANTLLQIAVWDRMAKVPVAEGGGQRFANEVVAAIPGLATDRVLVALKNQLPYLAEAAPVPLLVALEQMLEGNREGLRRVFAEAEGFLYPVSYHTGLLWALETIAWEPAHFERAVLLLAKLAALDPGGKLVNRPINSLGEIFLPWHPSTAAGPDRRLAALDLICKELPDIGWALTAKMLPTMHGIASGTARPKLREAASGEITITYEEFWSMQSAIIQRAVAQADVRPNRWHTLLAGITTFSPADRELTLKALSEVMPKFSDADRKSVWEDLLKEVEKHERFADAKWALPADQLAPLRALVDAYAPDDPLEQTRLLFDSWSFDAKGDREPVNSVRRARLSDLLHSHGPEAIANLAARVQNSYEVVDALGHIDVSCDQLEAIAAHSLTPEPNGFTVGLLATIANRFGVAAAQHWLLKTRQEKHLADAAVARLCQGLTDNRETWAFVKALGPEIETSYWSTKGPYWLKGEKDELLEAVHTYLAYGRGIAALEASLQRLDDLPTPTILAILEAIVHEVNAGSQRDATMISYETQKAFEELNKRDDISIEDIARREIAMFPLLEHSEYRMRVFEVLASSPGVYFEILKSVFRGEDEPEPSAEATATERGSWRINYSLLSNFHLIPGQTTTGIDEAGLARWIDEVRKLATDGKRLSIADQYIGHILAHSPDGADEAWPAEAIRAQLERVRSDEMERGLMIERFNMRGPHFRSLYGGGDDERGFAAQFNGYANKMDKWPRTQEMLRAIARNWEADARREDERAEQRKMKI